MGKWTRALISSMVAAAVMWWLDPADMDLGSYLGQVALFVAPFRGVIAIEDRLGGCGLCRLWS